MKFKILLNIGFIFLLAACSSPSPITNDISPPVNSIEATKKPYVLLVSIDGYRSDYTDRFSPPNLLKFRSESLTAKSLIPVFPSKTFPNHYSIVTGLYPEHHGIVANQFYDFARAEGRNFYKLNKAQEVTDGSWYGGTPLWVAAEKNQMLSACFFWPGSEAEIQNIKPTYFTKYDEKIPNATRIQQIINWLKLPEVQRPHFLTLYFSDVDSIGHEFGTESQELKLAVAKVDSELSVLFEELKKLNLPINTIIVSDHGMTNLDKEKIIYLDDHADFKDVYTADSGPQMFIYNHNLSVERLTEIYSNLKKHEKNFKVYWRKDLPKKLNFNENERAGEIVVVADLPYSLGLRSSNFKIPMATHGYDPIKYKDMHAIFYAQGPQIKNGKVKSFANVDIYPFIKNILGLPHDNKIDGSEKTLLPWLKLN